MSLSELEELLNVNSEAALEEEFNIGTRYADTFPFQDYEKEDLGPDNGPLDYTPVEPKVRSLDDVIGLDELKEELRLQLAVWAEPDGLRGLGGKARIGFVFSGPPGSGKTTSAHALAAETGKKLYTFSGMDFQAENGKDKLVSMIRRLRDEDAIVFVDEADDLLHKRDFRMERSGPLVKTMLVNLDQTTQSFRAFFIFATNMHPNGIDDALLHAGRLGRPLIFRHLRLDERVELLEHAGRSYNVAPGTLLMPLAAQMGDVPTANLAHLFDEGAFVAFRSGHSSITQEDLQEAAQRLRAGLERKKGWTPEQLRRVSVHEAGHAIVRLVTTSRWSSLGFVQISQRVEGNDGSTHENEDDTHFITRERVVDDIATCLAGGQAELLLLGSISNGHSADLENANDIADSAAASWAFGLGDASSRTYSNDRYWASNSQDDVWNGQAARLLLEGEVTARTMLRQEREALEELATRLADHKVADSNKVREWLQDLMPKVRD